MVIHICIIHNYVHMYVYRFKKAYNIDDDVNQKPAQLPLNDPQLHNYSTPHKDLNSGIPQTGKEG